MIAISDHLLALYGFFRWVLFLLFPAPCPRFLYQVKSLRFKPRFVALATSAGTRRDLQNMVIHELPTESPHI